MTQHEFAPKLPSLPPEEYFEAPIYYEACRALWDDPSLAAVDDAVILGAMRLGLKQLNKMIPHLTEIHMRSLDIDDSGFDNPEAEPEFADLLTKNNQLKPEVRAVQMLRGIICSEDYLDYMADYLTNFALDDADARLRGDHGLAPSRVLAAVLAQRRLEMNNS